MNPDGFTSISYRMSPPCVSGHATGIDRRQEMSNVDRINRLDLASECMACWRSSYVDSVEAYDP